MPTVQTLVNSLMHGAMHESKMKMAFNTVAAGGAQQVIGENHAPVQIIDPEAASIDVLLPVEANAKNVAFIIFNNANAAETLVVKDDSDTNTIVTLAQNEGALVFCDGVVWRGLVGGIT